MYTIEEAGYEPNYLDVYTCRGFACNVLRGVPYILRKSRTVKESRLLYHGNDLPQSEDLLYRCVDLDTKKTTAWYFTESEAIEAAKACHLHPADTYNGKDYYCRQTAVVCTEKVDPLPQKFTVDFKRDEKGRIYTRFDAHPELTGNSPEGKGKIFFPDHNFKAADVGEALVSVSKEMDNFGFVTGEMVKFDCPDMKAVLDWAWEKENPYSELVIINHPARGRYYAVWDGKGFSQVFQDTDLEGNSIVYSAYTYDDVIKEDAERYTERRATFSQLFFEDVWGADIDFDAIEASFKESRFYDATYLCNSVRWQKSTKFHSRTISDAVEKGILEQFQSQSLKIDIVTVNWDNQLNMLAYSLEEIKQLAVEVADINAKADKVAENLRRKQKLIW